MSERIVWKKKGTNATPEQRPTQVVRSWSSTDGQHSKTRTSKGTENPRSTSTVVLDGAEQDVIKRQGSAVLHTNVTDRRQEAFTRDQERRSRTALEQLKVLDRRLGVNVGAERERARLEVLMTDDERAKRQRETTAKSKKTAAEKLPPKPMTRPEYRAKKKAGKLAATAA